MCINTKPGFKQEQDVAASCMEAKLVKIEFEKMMEGVQKSNGRD